MIRHSLCLSVLLVACRTPAGATDAPHSPDAGSAAVTSDADLTTKLCKGRASCSIRRRQTAGDGEVVELALGRGTAQECDGAEYWFVHRSPLSTRRIASDCDQQTEADELGHADVRVDGADLKVAYQELQGGDRCAGVDARFRLAPFHLAKETRFEGEYVQHECRRGDELSIDWDASDHYARWIQANCGGKSGPAGQGAAIPKFTMSGGTPPTGVGTCGVLLDAARAARWMKGSVDSHVVLRTMVVDDRLLVEVKGASAGTVSIVVASAAPGDGDYGGLGCASDDERGLSTATVHLENGKIDAKGTQAPFVRIAGRDADTLLLATESIASIGRIALSYESPDHEKLESAWLRSPPSARELPALEEPARATDRCQLQAGRLDVRIDNAASDPAVELR